MLSDDCNHMVDFLYEGVFREVLLHPLYFEDVTWASAGIIMSSWMVLSALHSSFSSDVIWPTARMNEVIIHQETFTLLGI